MIVDYHMHLRRPAPVAEEPEHTVEAVERYAEVAAARGVDEIGISEHVYYFIETSGVWTVPYQRERCTRSLDDYCDTVLEAKRRGLPVKLALEVDWVPERAGDLAEILAPYPWDYVLGSVHWIDGVAVDQQPGLWAGHTVAEVWDRYVRELTAAALSGHFDVLAHPDLAKVFGDKFAYDWTLAVASWEHVCVEISTAGLHKPVRELYPDPQLLRLARASDTPITLASDAHAAEDVGRDFDQAVELARDAGYDTVTVFDRRRRRQEPLG